MNALYQVLGISKQAAHKRLTRLRDRAALGQDLAHMVAKVRRDHPTMGLRDIYFKMRPQRIGRDAFEQLMREAGYASKRFRNHAKTTNSNGVIRFENLFIGIRVKAINEVWQSDITYFELCGRFYYLTFIVDVFSSRIIGHAVSSNLTARDTSIAALHSAVSNRKGQSLKGLIFHSDGGGQYYADAFLRLTNSLGMRNSMCEMPQENAFAERVNGVIKNNYMKFRTIKTYPQLVKEVDRTVQLYNFDKPHIRLSRMTPVAFETTVTD